MHSDPPLPFDTVLDTTHKVTSPLPYTHILFSYLLELIQPCLYPMPFSPMNRNVTDLFQHFSPALSLLPSSFQVCFVPFFPFFLPYF